MERGRGNRKRLSDALGTVGLRTKQNTNFDSLRGRNALFARGC